MEILNKDKNINWTIRNVIRFTILLLSKEMFTYLRYLLLCANPFKNYYAELFLPPHIIHSLASEYVASSWPYFSFHSKY